MSEPFVFYLTKQQLLGIHLRVVMATGGEHGVRDPSALSNCIYYPTTRVYGQDVFKTIFEKTAALMYGIVVWHPFIEANKRTAFIAAYDMLSLNGYDYSPPAQNTASMLRDLAIRSADTDSPNTSEIKRLSGHLKAYSTG